MSKDLTFTEVCDFIKNDDNSLLTATEHLLGVAIICTPLVLGPGALPALGLLGVKSDLTALGRKLLSMITSKEESDYLSRMRRMEIAYGLICYTAFFEALDRLLPDDLRNEINLQPQEKLHIAGHAEKLATGKPRVHEKECLLGHEGPFSEPLPFPHPVISFEELKEQFVGLYDQMAKGFYEFAKQLEVIEQVDEEKTKRFQESLKSLSKTAIDCFEAQYFELAKKYEDFWVWAQLYEHRATRVKVGDLSNQLREHRTLAIQSKKRIDVGFIQLQKTVLAIPDQFRAIEATEIVQGLKRNYDARIADAIIEDKSESEEGKVPLSFPKISEAFIPQAYAVLRYSSRERHLEREETWSDRPRQNDLGAFLLSYLSSPYSHDTPMLILGHPGSGKSLLTKVLCANLMSAAYTPIRVPLREVDTDVPIESQIDDEIQRITGNRFQNWANFSAQFSQRPLIILLDGYDELLQASGKIHSGYLKTVYQFQQREAEQGRPVRIIVTSRIALIDKATVPDGSTVLRLLEFSKDQRNAWIKVWNKKNTRYFASSTSKTKQFELPDEEKVLSLAKQPLLLLMLALFDSDGNALRQHKKLDRTVLYDSLLRRFIKREQRKSSEFDELTKEQKHSKIDREMQRLGVAAIGMYNRKKLHIPSVELGQDLQFFDLESRVDVQSGRPATPADLLLGSFFFVHKAQARHGDETEHGDESTSLEFLHNTFGEFLTADFILRYALLATDIVQDMSGVESLKTNLLKKLEEPTGLDKEWFACLSYAPLYARPVVLEMIREWARHVVYRGKRRSWKKFLICLDQILQSQITMILSGRNLPAIRRSDDGACFGEIPVLGHTAIYTINLIVLRTILDDTEFCFDESFYSTEIEVLEPISEDVGPETQGTRPWDRLTYLWRSWFTLDNLSGLPAVLSARRDGSQILLKGRESFQTRLSRNRLEAVLNVGRALADDTIVGLAGLHSNDFGGREWLGLDEVEKLLNAEKINLSFEFLVRRFREHLSYGNAPSNNLDELIITGFKSAVSFQQRPDLIVAFFDLLGIALRRRCLSLRCEYELRERFLERHMFSHIGNDEFITLQLLRLMREVEVDRHWIERFNEDIFGPDKHAGRFTNMMERRPEVAIEWLRLIHNSADRRQIDRITKEVFEHDQIPGRFAKMMDQRPDVVIEWLRVMQEVSGGHQWIERFGEEIFEHAMHSRHFVEIIEMRPEIAIEWLRLMQEVGGDHHWIARFGEEIFEHAMYPGRFVEMMEMRPEIAIGWLQLIREVGGGRHWIERFGEEVFGHAMHPRRFVDMMEMRPEIAIEWLRLMQAVGGDHHWIARFGEEIFEHAMHPGRFVEMMEMRPEIAIEWLRLMQAVGGDHHWIERFGEEIFGYAMHPRRFVEMMKMRPEVAIKWLRMIRNFDGDHSLIEGICKFFHHDIQSSQATVIFSKNQDSALAVIRVLRTCGDEDFLNNLQGAHQEDSSSPAFSGRMDLTKVPLDYIGDVQWYAKATSNKKLLRDIAFYTGMRIDDET